MEKGEFIIFCKDFQIKLPKSKILEIFLKASRGSAPLELEDFKKTLPHLGIEYSKAKSNELKFRLKEIKSVLEYPRAKVTEAMERIINDVPEGEKVMEKRAIDQYVSFEDETKEQKKTEKILAEIEKTLKMKRLLSEIEHTPYVPT